MKNSLRKVKKYALSYYMLWRFGKIQAITTEKMGYMEMERKYVARGQIIGWWCYGNYDPNGAYKGQELCSFCFDESISEVM